MLGKRSDSEPLYDLSPQSLIGTDSISNLHKLEQVSSDEGIGTLAENLLEALREHADVNLKIDAARRETRSEKKRMAMAMRQKALGTLGMTVRAAGGTMGINMQQLLSTIDKVCYHR